MKKAYSLSFFFSHKRFQTTIRGLAMTLMAGVFSSSTIARPEPLIWDKLEFKGSKFLISLNAEISREKISVQQAMTELYKPEDHIAKQPNGDYVLKTQIKTAVLGNQSHFIAWQNPNLEALQRTTLYSGLKNWYRNYRYLPGEAYSLKIEPAAGESVEDWQQWTDIRQSLHAFRPPIESGPNSEGNKPLSESAAIFDVLAMDHLEKTGDEHTLHVFNRRGNFAVTLRAVDQQLISVEYQQSIQGNLTKRKNQTNVLRVRLDAKQLEIGRKSTDFKFMGYKDSIYVYYDPILNLPLRLKGEVEYAGNVEINLKKARLVKELTIKP